MSLVHLSGNITFFVVIMNWLRSHPVGGLQFRFLKFYVCWICWWCILILNVRRGCRYQPANICGTAQSRRCGSKVSGQFFFQFGHVHILYTHLVCTLTSIIM